MRMKTGALVLAGVLFGAAALLPAVSEGRGGGPGRGRCGQSECRQISQNCPQEGQGPRDGSCGNDSCPQNGRGCRAGGNNRGAGAQDGSGTSTKQ